MKSITDLLFQKTSVAYAILEVTLEDHAIIEDYTIRYANDAFLQMFPGGIQNNKLILNTDGVGNYIRTTMELANANPVKYNQYSNIYAKLFLFEVIALDDTHIALRAKDINKSFLREDEGDVFYRINVDMLCVSDKVGNYLSVSKDMLSVLHYQESDMVGKRILDFVHPDDITPMRRLSQEILKAKDVKQCHCRIRALDGSYLHMEWRIKLEGSYIYSSARDISETVKAQEQLKRANETLLQHSLQIEQANRDLELLSNTDALTGIYNRYFINKRLNEESKRMLRYHHPLSLVFFDVDHFKNINDSFGHLVGDDILQWIVSIVKENIRDSDIFGRWGGEEFLIIAPHTTQEAAWIAAEKLRILISDSRHPLVGQVTCSFGVVQRYANETLKEVYERVDDALYHAKNDGRNRVYTSQFAEQKSFDSVYLEWNENLYCGNPTIDRQHERVMKLGNDLIAMILSSESEEEIKSQAIDFFNYMQFHFQSEENILRDLKYPNLIHHQKEHDRLLWLGKYYIDSNILQRSPVTFFSFLLDEIVFGHLMQDDFAFFDLFKDKT